MSRTPAISALLAGLTALLIAKAEAQVKLVLPKFEAEPFRDCDTCPTMLTLPSGLQISQAPVTRGEFSAFVSATGFSREGWGCNWNYAHIEQTDDHPVVCVTFLDAEKYAGWLSERTGHSYRLPTVEEMRYAAMGNESGNYWWGQAVGSNRANCAACGSQWDGTSTSPVGAFDSNPFGLKDAVGNVWIWTSDCREGSCDERKLIGGSWSSPPGDLRITKVIWNEVDVPFNTYGIRVVREER
ncbi:MAG: formylglycine-generating enzyme family protein [Rhizobiaceae bacterium]|nr:formylglycine-generating enzyme family protein [Rhizobiaceae bacterium]MCV0405285.1 formylglycine-generating enzyme family protein [Rhizobiaceae bacterium]